MKKWWKVQQPRTRVVVYEREIAAETAEEACSIAAQGTAWPESYDERTTELTEGEYSATEETDPIVLEVRGDPNDPDNPRVQ